MVIVDTNALFIALDEADPQHEIVKEVLSAVEGPLVVSPYVIAELDYLLVKRRGVTAEITAMTELSGGAWELPELGASDLAESVTVLKQYRDQAIGVTDASIVVLAKRYDTRTIATLDRRHFDVLRPLQGGTFEIVP